MYSQALGRVPGTLEEEPGAILCPVSYALFPSFCTALTLPLAGEVAAAMFWLDLIT